jgi:glucose uptake protein GlcU
MPLPDWLFADWQSNSPLVAGMMPFVFVVAIVILVVALTFIVRKHIYRRPLDTTYFTCIGAIVWSINVLSMFVFRAVFGPNQSLSLIQLASMLILILVPQSKMCRNYIKNAIKNDMQKK